MFPIGDLSDIISPIRNWTILKLFYWQKFIFEFSDSRCCHLQFFGIKNLKIHLRKFHNQSRHECFYETCHLGPFRNFLSLTSHINKVHGIDSYVNLKDGYRIHSETYPSEIDSGGDRQEGDQQEVDRQEGDRQEGDQQEGDHQEGDQQEGDRQEGDQQEGDPHGGDCQEGGNDGEPEGDNSGLDEDIILYCYINQNLIDCDIPDPDLEIHNFRNKFDEHISHL